MLFAQADAQSISALNLFGHKQRASLPVKPGKSAATDFYINQAKILDHANAVYVSIAVALTLPSAGLHTMTTPDSHSRILILYAHPDAMHSRANNAMIAAANSSAKVLVHDLYEHYPDFHIDVAHEQQLLQQADMVVLHHPIHWYSMPSLQKEWIDCVLQRGWAFGPGGNALRGKDFWLVTTTGGEADDYQADARHGFRFDEFLPPYRQTAQLCGMQWRTPYVLHDAHKISQEALTLHAANYRALLDTYPQWPAALEMAQTTEASE